MSTARTPEQKARAAQRQKQWRRREKQKREALRKVKPTPSVSTLEENETLCRNLYKIEE